MPRAVWKRVLEYLDAIDEREGKFAIRQDFYNIAENENNLNRAVMKLKEYRIIREERVETEIGKVRYYKTDIGQKVHEVLKSHDYLEPFFEEMGRRRFML